MKHLKEFQKVVPNKHMFDLSQDVHKRRRTENIDKTLPCLTTSAQLWPHDFYFNTCSFCVSKRNLFEKHLFHTMDLFREVAEEQAFIDRP